MEYSKDIIFNIKYAEEEKKSWTSIVKEKVKKHKIITIITLTCAILMAVDFALIFNFAQVLQTSAIVM